MLQFGSMETSGKTTEMNTLSDLTVLIENLCGRKVAIVSPTTRDERKLGFDELIEDLSPGRLLALQFRYRLCWATPCHAKSTTSLCPIPLTAT